MIHTININSKDLALYASTYEIKSVLEVNDKILTLLINSDKINIKNKTQFNLPDMRKSNVKSNVAIASAVTAYARIYMSQFKNRNDFELLYTDTDSIMIDKPLSDDLIGKELGLMKYELIGQSIKEAYFLGIKQYGYWYLDDKGNRIEKSVFAGVKRDSLTFDQILRLFKGEIISTLTEQRRFKSLKKLNITLKNITTHISFKPSKLLENNKYLPIRLNNNIIKKLSIWIKDKITR